MFELENLKSLEAFRMEIMNLRARNDSLRLGVSSSEDLGAEEMLAWNTFKQLFERVEAGLMGLDNIKDVQSSNVLKECLKELVSLKSVIESNLKEEDILTNINRKEFLAWLKNRLVLSSNLAFLFPDEDSGDDYATQEDLNSIKEFIKRARNELFV